MTTKAVIFIGPTLPLSEAKAILDATYLPPARQGDLLSVVTTLRPPLIGLIDGEFGQSLSVWHKEILFALENGVHVYGASSIGALRAAETSVFGMLGVGEVYRMFATGQLEDDDEVAVAHGGAESGYRPVSEPMVNLRMSFERARNEGMCDAATCGQLVEIAKSMFYPERTLVRVLRQAEDSGVSAAAVARVERFLETNFVDIKRQDAILLLQTIRGLPAPLPSFVPDFRLERPHTFTALYERDRTVRRDGVDVPLHAIADYAALHMPEFGVLNFNAMNRAFAVAIADLLGIQLSAERLAAEGARFRRRLGLERDDDFFSWIARNDLTLDEWSGLIRQVATCRRLHQWLMLRKYATRNARIVLDELRLSGRYEDVIQAAAAYERIVQAAHVDDLHASASDTDLDALMREHLQSAAWELDADVELWSEEAGFASLADLRVELVRARLVRRRTERAASALLELTADADGQVGSLGPDERRES